MDLGHGFSNLFPVFLTLALGFHLLKMLRKGIYLSTPLPSLVNIVQESFWQAFATLDVLIDVSCGVLSVLLFYDLNMVLKAKIAVTLAFAARLS
jgi:hypothetical protein